MKTSIIIERLEKVFFFKIQKKIQKAFINFEMKYDGRNHESKCKKCEWFSLSSISSVSERTMYYLYIEVWKKFLNRNYHQAPKVKSDNAKS